MKTILGLDLGTNSIGWALTSQDFNNKQGKIIGLGSRIIPMSQDILDTFGKGQSHSQTAERTHYRGVRRLYQRDNLRRERLHRVLNILGFLPEHYAEAIDFLIHPGQFKELSDGDYEVKINYLKNGIKPNVKQGFQFLFMDSFNEMVEEFRKAGNHNRIPPDWTLYYLRKKALGEKISKEELAWVILNFNKKRGYYQRGEEDETDSLKMEEFHALRVQDIIAMDDKNAKGVWYNVILENGWIYRRQSNAPLDEWRGKTKEFIVTTQLDKDGTPKTDSDGEIKRSFRSVNSEEDWVAIKAKTELDIERSEKTAGEFIYETLLQNPHQKIRGKLVRTIERKFYKEELRLILEKQCKFHPELTDRELYSACLKELYSKNDAHRNNIKGNGFVHLFMNDIIFYQRPLKSKKSTISLCGYETRTYKTVEREQLESGEKAEKQVVKTEGVRCIARSHPLFQEFRLWQFINNLKIYKKEFQADVDVTILLLPSEDDIVALYEYLNTRKEIGQKHVIGYLVKQRIILQSEKGSYRWNYVEDKVYPGNEIRTQFISRLKRIGEIEPEKFFTKETETHLWHIIYSVNDKMEYEKALGSFARRYNLNESAFLENFRRFKPFNRDYGSYSEKAIKKLLPLMRMGMYWAEKEIDSKTKERIIKIVNGEYDENIRDRVREKALKFESIENFRGLPTWLASYVVYDRHSESVDNTKWKSPGDIDKFLSEFKQHSLRNPIVEQVLTETLRVVRDIWTHFGNGKEGFFDEIHVELGREMKNPANIRKKMAGRMTVNENTNNRIRLLLKELINDDEVEGDVRSYSPSHQDILKIYEEGVYQGVNQVDDEIEKIRKNASPTTAEIRKYKLWLDQGYISPYTGKVIPLSSLFTTDYQIEHIIPQARYFDDSLSNKVICESEVNEVKDNRTAYEFIKAEKGRIIELTAGKTVKLSTVEQFEYHCKRYFKGNREKLKKLMSEDIPEGFIERQMNDTRYISKMVKSLLNSLVRDERDKESISPNLLPVTGVVTAKLKKDWGLNDKWKEIIAPRFQRLNIINGSQEFGYWDKAINSYRCSVPDDEKKGFSYKRIDHRHHALDALIVACTNRRHIQYLNALNAESVNYALRDSLLVKSSQGHHTKSMLLPWNGFPVDALTALKTTLVSFKHNTRVINKTNNKTWQWVSRNGELKKELVPQTKGDNWAIRKPLHKETVNALVRIRLKKEVPFSNGLKDWKNLEDKGLKKKIRSLYKEGKDEKIIFQYFKQNPYMKNGKPVERLVI
ncbi:MAG TPA: CRISPR-associated protein Csn1, partial [Bacteroides sp.]|nr:CRISPR-associated protein Csn1 [Bacteroides sp.]